jgi:hypothetical protein
VTALIENSGRAVGLTFSDLAAANERIPPIPFLTELVFKQLTPSDLIMVLLIIFAGLAGCYAATKKRNTSNWFLDILYASITSCLLLGIINCFVVVFFNVVFSTGLIVLGAFFFAVSLDRKALGLRAYGLIVLLSALIKLTVFDTSLLFGR